MRYINQDYIAIKPIELADREIKETRWFFNTFVIELEARKDG